MRIPYRVETPADLNRCIAVSESVGAIGLTILLRALRDGLIALFPILPQTSNTEFKRFAAMTAQKPTIALIGDDDDLHRGPDGWPAHGRVMRWANSIVLHAAAAQAEHYDTAVVAARLALRVAVIECSSTTLPAWHALTAALPHKPPVLGIIARGGLHPLPQARETMH